MWVPWYLTFSKVHQHPGVYRAVPTSQPTHTHSTSVYCRAPAQHRALAGRYPSTCGSRLAAGPILHILFFPLSLLLRPWHTPQQSPIWHLSSRSLSPANLAATTAGLVVTTLPPLGLHFFFCNNSSLRFIFGFRPSCHDCDDFSRFSHDPVHPPPPGHDSHHSLHHRAETSSL